MSRRLLAELVRGAGAETRVENGADIGVVDHLAEEVDPIELARVGRGQERVIGLGDQFRPDPEVLEQLGLEFGGDGRRVRQVGPRLGAEVDLRREAVGVAGRGEQLLALAGIELVPGGAGTAVRDDARRVVTGHLGARREEALDDAPPVDPHRDRASHPLVVERRERVGEAEVEDVEARSRLESQADVVVDFGRPRRVEEVDPVDVGSIQFVEATGGVLAPTDDHSLVPGRGAPVSVVAGEADLRARLPALEAVRTGPVDVGDDRLGRGSGRVDP